MTAAKDLMDTDLMAAVTARYLSKDDALRVAAVFMKHPARASALLSAYAGETLTGRDFAALVLQVAKRIQREGDGASA